MSWIADARYRTPKPSIVGLPLRYNQAEPEDVPPGQLQDAVFGYLATFEDRAAMGVAPVLLGQAQRYKTVAAAAIARKVHQSFTLSVCWIDAPSDLMLLERSRYTDVSRKRVDGWRAVPFLVIDDFYAVGAQGWMGQVLVELITVRFNACLPTLWTGNVKCPEDDPFRPLLQSWGPTFTRRLQDTGRGFTVLID